MRPYIVVGTEVYGDWDEGEQTNYMYLLLDEGGSQWTPHNLPDMGQEVNITDLNSACSNTSIVIHAQITTPTDPYMMILGTTDGHTWFGGGPDEPASVEWEGGAVCYNNGFYWIGAYYKPEGKFPTNMTSTVCWYSADGVSTWEQVGIVVPEQLGSMTIEPGRGQFVATSDGVMHAMLLGLNTMYYTTSSDYGVNWTPDRVEVRPPLGIHLCAMDTRLFRCCGGTLSYRNGTSWVEVGSHFGPIMRYGNLLMCLPEFAPGGTIQVCANWDAASPTLVPYRNITISGGQGMVASSDALGIHERIAAYVAGEDTFGTTVKVLTRGGERQVYSVTYDRMTWHNEYDAGGFFPDSSGHTWFF